MRNSKALRKDVLHMAWPSVIESVFIALTSMIDTLMVSSLGAYAVAAIGLTTQPKFIGLAFFMALNTALSSLIARRLGERKQKEAHQIFITALLCTLMMTLLISMIFVNYADVIMQWCGSNSDTHQAATSYFKIIMGTTFFNAISFCINSAQRGAGNTKIAMRTNITSSCVNVLFNYLFINGKLGFPAWGVEGAAWATVIGSVVSMIMSMASLLPQNGFLSLHYFLQENVKPALTSLVSLLKLAANFFFEALAMRIGFITTAIYAARLGTEIFAVHNVGMSVLHLGFAAGEGMQVAAVALIGRSLGEKNPLLAKKYGYICLQFGSVIAGVLIFLTVIGNRQFFSLFFPGQTQILLIGQTISYYLMITCVFLIAQAIYTGCLRGAGDAFYTLVVAFISVTILRSAITYLLFENFHLGLHSIWLGILSDQVARALFNGYRFHRGKWTELTI